jgi:antitoxin ParD1/3/4
MRNTRFFNEAASAEKHMSVFDIRCYNERRRSAMPARNIHLTAEWDSFVTDRVQSGQYANASEVVRAGLRALEQSEAEDRAKIEALRAAIQEGLEGPFYDGETVMADLKKQLAQRAKRHSRALTA